LMDQWLRDMKPSPLHWHLTAGQRFLNLGCKEWYLK